MCGVDKFRVVAHVASRAIQVVTVELLTKPLGDAEHLGRGQAEMTEWQNGGTSELQVHILKCSLKCFMKGSQ
jgi:hypothetical protein